MGSKYRLVPHLAGVFAEVGGATALDAFSGSGVVSYLLKTLGYQVTANDFLNFPAVIARAAVANQGETLTGEDIAAICGPAADDRDFIQRTFDGLFFTGEDRQFLDSAWSHIAKMTGTKQALAISALVLSAARKQPRGVFTVTGLRGADRRVQPRGLRQRAAVHRHHWRRLRPWHPALRPGLPRPAVRPAPGRQLLHQALPLPGGAEHLLARPADHAEHPDQEAPQAVYAFLV
jgi:hypothetical protein